jgi:protein tyrosine phosphatase (PTP) superfamily phosphohydrolase (DUF442 family)
MEYAVDCQAESRNQTRSRLEIRRIVAGLAMLSAFGATIGLCVDSLKYHFVAKRFGVVVPGLIYRSGQISPSMIEPTIRRHGIQVIVNLQHHDPRDIHQLHEIATAEELSVEYHRVPMSGDGTGETDDYAKVVQILSDCRKAGRPVLVHCAAGAERTGGVVATYRLLIERQPPATVMSELQSYGSSLTPDSELVAYLNVHLPEIARKLEARGVIGDVPDPIPTLNP